MTVCSAGWGPASLLPASLAGVYAAPLDRPLRWEEICVPAATPVPAMTARRARARTAARPKRRSGASFSGIADSHDGLLATLRRERRPHVLQHREHPQRGPR